MLTYDALPPVLLEIAKNPRFRQFHDALERAGKDIRMAGYYAEYARIQELREGRITTHLRKAHKSVGVLLSETARLRGLRAAPLGSDEEYRALLDQMLAPSAGVIEDVMSHIENAVDLLNGTKGQLDRLEVARKAGKLPIDGDLLTEPGPCHLHREMLCQMAVRCDLQLKTMAVMLEAAARRLRKLPGSQLSTRSRRKGFH